MTNPQMRSDQACANGPALETEANEAGILARLGFSDDEITSLLWLRQWYQHGGSDRVEVVRRLEWLKDQTAQAASDN